MNFITVHKRKHFISQNISLFAILSNTVTKAVFCITIVAKKEQSLLLKYNSSSYIINENGIVTFGEGRRSDHFLYISQKTSLVCSLFVVKCVAILED